MDLKAVGEEKPRVPHACPELRRRVSRSSGRGTSEVSNKSEPDCETIVARRQRVSRKIKLNLPEPYKNPRGFRDPAKRIAEPKKKPAINLFDRLAQRREEYKKREGIM